MLVRSMSSNGKTELNWLACTLQQKPVVGKIVALIQGTGRPPGFQEIGDNVKLPGRELSGKNLLLLLIASRKSVDVDGEVMYTLYNSGG